MGKTPETLRLEDAIWSATKNQGTFGCFEVTIGWFGKERVARKNPELPEQEVRV